MATWSTPENVAALTGETVTEQDVYRAYKIIELFTGVSVDQKPYLTKRNLVLLEMAEGYQTAWMKSKPALFARSDTGEVIQDTLQWDKGDRDMHVLAPLAKTSIMKLSWMRTRTLIPLTPDQALILRNKLTPQTIGRDLDIDEAFGWTDWEPM